MKNFIPEIFESSIIVVGKFNPAIFSPDWLAGNNLIGSEDAKSALQNPSFMITTQMSRFETEWFVLQVLNQQFSLSSKGPISPAIKDLAVHIFSLLPHTPVTALGLNFMAHYKIQTVKDYYKIGDVLAPKTIWDGINFFNEQSTGLESLTIRVDPFKRKENSLDHQNKDVKRVIVQPSGRVPQGVFFTFNDHHDIEHFGDLSFTKAEHVSNIINKKWDDTWVEAKGVFGKVLQNALK